MNFFIDAYHFLVISIAAVIAIPFTEGVVIAFIFLFVMKKLGMKKILWVKMLSLIPVSQEDEGLKKNKKYRLFNDIFNLALIFFVFVRIPLWVISQKLVFHQDAVYERTDSAYRLDRDEWLEGSLMAGLPLFPYVWIPVVVGINKYRQWVDVETMVTWKYHDERRRCFWSGYEDSSCGYAMDMARALHRDDESLSIGKKYVEARKPLGGYSYCSALGDLQAHAEETKDVELYKEMVKKRCELECRRSCVDHKWAQKLPIHRLKNKFRDRDSLESFL